MEQRPSDFLSKNWSIIIGVLTAVFVAGGIVSEFRILSAEIQELKREMEIKFKQMNDERDRKSDWLEEQEQRIDDLEEWKAYEDGYKSASK
jgi:hypothetical protein